jgi:DNA repair protein RadC
MIPAMTTKPRLHSSAPILMELHTERIQILAGDEGLDLLRRGVLKTRNDVLAALTRAIMRHMDQDREHVFVFCLDPNEKLLGYQHIATGGPFGVEVHPSLVFKPAILFNASSVVVVHNHPSGEAGYSREDLKLTTTLMDAGRLLAIHLADHLIVTKETYTEIPKLRFHRRKDDLL